MTGEARKHWMEFCERAAVEQDPQKLILLAREINRLCLLYTSDAADE